MMALADDCTEERQKNAATTCEKAEVTSEKTMDFLEQEDVNHDNQWQLKTAFRRTMSEPASGTSGSSISENDTSASATITETRQRPQTTSQHEQQQQQQQQPQGTSEEMEISSQSLPERRRNSDSNSSSLYSSNRHHHQQQKRGLSWRSWAQGEQGSSSCSSINSSNRSVNSCRRRRILEALTRASVGGGGGEQDPSEASQIEDDEISVGDLKKSRFKSHPNSSSKTTSIATASNTKSSHDSDITSMTAPMFNQSQGPAVSADEESASSSSQSRGQTQATDNHGPAHDSGDDSSSCEIIMDDNDDSSASSSDGGDIVFHDASEYEHNQHSPHQHHHHHSSGVRTCDSYYDSMLRSKAAKRFNAWRLICGKMVNNKWVQILIVVLIILNALQMGLSTFDIIDQNPDLKHPFAELDTAFLIVFTVELVFQLIYHGYNLFQDGWLVFDLIIVIMSWTLASLQVFRTLRTLRLVARIEMLRKLCQALVESLPRISGICFLFCLIMYIYGVMCTILFGDLHERGLTKEDYFSRLDTTLFTLFQMITLDYAKIVREVSETHSMAPLVFVTYLCFTSFILFSMIIAVVCDAVSVVEHDSSLLEGLERKENVQERILMLQQRVDYLKNQQVSVMARVNDVLYVIQKNDPLRQSVSNTHATSSITSNNTAVHEDAKRTDEGDGETNAKPKLHTE